MRVVLNRGFILERAVLSILRDYLADLRLAEVYPNNKIHASGVHPFSILLREDGRGVADTFPCVYVSASQDSKDSDLIGMPPQMQGLAWVGYTQEDITLIKNERGAYSGSEASLDDSEERGVGACSPIADSVFFEIQKRLQEKEFVYGYQARFYRKEEIRLEIWAENLQLKNELYEAARLFALGELRHELASRFGFFDPKIDDGTVRGDRLFAYNVDFGVPIAGAFVSLECTYSIEQNILDTTWEDRDVEFIIGGK